MGVQLTGMDKITIKIKNMNKDLEKDIKQVVKKNGALMQSEMTKAAHFGRYAKNPTTQGNLKRSIRTEIKDNGYTAETGPNVEYAAYVEYGTRKMRAQPYAKTAYDKVVPKFIDDLEKLAK